jgi:hypothetical protein
MNSSENALVKIIAGYLLGKILLPGLKLLNTLEYCKEVINSNIVESIRPLTTIKWSEAIVISDEHTQMSTGRSAPSITGDPIKEVIILNQNHPIFNVFYRKLDNISYKHLGGYNGSA